MKRSTSAWEEKHRLSRSLGGSLSDEGAGAAPSQSGRLSGRRILVVEDDSMAVSACPAARNMDPRLECTPLSRADAHTSPARPRCKQQIARSRRRASQLSVIIEDYWSERGDLNSRPQSPKLRRWLTAGSLCLGSLLTRRLPRGRIPKINKSIKAFFTKAFNGEPGWDRTNDHLIKSQI
jgi:hypothetical protein